jgi:hypothetical protein
MVTPMTEKPIQRLQYLCTTIPPLLSKIKEDNFSSKPSSDKWSKKEILGHLIDSATNNHQRFVRVQFEHVPTISYDQIKWNSHTHYNQIDSKHLISFWAAYNLHLVELIKLIPKDNLTRECNIGRDTPVTLQWLIDDYVRHLEHHLKQIVEYK